MRAKNGEDFEETLSTQVEKIPFHIPFQSGMELAAIRQVLEIGRFTGEGPFLSRCETSLQEQIGVQRVLLTPSCTQALEIMALLCDIRPGDEVILSSFTFVSTANAFALRGAKLVFADIRPDTMNLDERLVTAAISDRTRAIVAMHYGGVACEMAALLSMAQQNHLFLLEDAAHCIGARYSGRHLGTFGQLGALSFHESKNIHCGEGGALLINDERFVERAEVLREKGTDKRAFLRGETDRYTWKDLGSSYSAGELAAAFLHAQLELTDEVRQKHLRLWQRYFQNLQSLQESGLLDLPFVPQECEHNGHIFYVKCRDRTERAHLISFLNGKGIATHFHYVPLHSSPAGRRFGRFAGEDVFTTRESERLLRLPMFYALTEDMVDRVCEAVFRFYN